MIKLLWACVAASLLNSCQESGTRLPLKKKPFSQALTDDQEKFANFPLLPLDAVDDLNDIPLQSRDDLRVAFCIDAYKLPKFADFTDLLAIVCSDGKPNQMFEKLDRYAGRVGTSPQAIEISIDHSADNFTNTIYAVSYRLPIETKWLRIASIPSYTVAKIEVDHAKSYGRVTADLTSSLGGTLQYGKWTTATFVEIDIPNSEQIKYERTTEVNSYQVRGGVPDLGLTLEHLTSQQDPKSRQYRIMTISIANNDSSTTVITFVNMSMANHGHPDIARKIINNLANAQNIRVYRGILAELRAGYFDDKGR